MDFLKRKLWGAGGGWVNNCIFYVCSVIFISPMSKTNRGVESRISASNISKMELCWETYCLNTRFPKSTLPCKIKREAVFLHINMLF